jgi:riboflavin synthase alpha subunit
MVLVSLFFCFVICQCDMRMLFSQRSFKEMKLERGVRVSGLIGGHVVCYLVSGAAEVD